MARRLTVEPAHTPIAINRVEAFADPFQNKAEFGLRVDGQAGKVGDGHAELVSEAHRRRCWGWQRWGAPAHPHGAPGVCGKGTLEKPSTATIALDPDADDNCDLISEIKSLMQQPV